MLGKIVKISQEKQMALILADDGKQYVFYFRDWCDNGEIKIGLRVEFDILNEKQANNVFLANEIQAKLLGKIIKISQEKQLALILGDNSRQYVFAFHDWGEQVAPEINMRVHFVAFSEKQAGQVFLADEFADFEKQTQSRFGEAEQANFRQSENHKTKTKTNHTAYEQSSTQNDTRFKYTFTHDNQSIVVLEQPSVMEYIKSNLAWKGFSGRASVKELWSFNLLVIALGGLIIGPAFLIESMIKNPSEGFELIMMAWFLLWGLLLLYPCIVGVALGVRRLHDFNISGWVWLGVVIVSFIPILNILAVIVSLILSIMVHFINSRNIENKYGFSTVYDYADENED